MEETAEDATARVASLSAALGAELTRRDAHDLVRSSLWPTVGAVAGHVTSIYGWVTTILQTGSPADRTESPLDDDTMVATVGHARQALLDELALGDRACWIIGGGDGTTAFWRRRMALETLKHLLDLRTAPTERFAVPPELDVSLAADGVDEFWPVFLARNRARLTALPGSVVRRANDAHRAWRSSTDGLVTTDDSDGADAVIESSAAELLLLLWERASVRDESDRFAVTGNHGVVAALESTPIHR